MDFHKNCEDPGDGDGERMLPEAGNGDGKYFRWWDNE
jgi:hypothetical protein